MKSLMKKLEHLLELGGIKKDITLLVISGIVLILGLCRIDVLPFDISIVAIVLCGVPIVAEAVIGLVTSFDIKADVLVSIALIASVCIGETFAAGEVAFDKTGTLTHGEPKVIKTVSIVPEYSADDLYTLCASAERLSEHPIGKAIVECRRLDSSDKLPQAENFMMIPGRGVGAAVCGKSILAGNREMMSDSGIEVSDDAVSRAAEYLDLGCTAVFIAVNGKLSGFTVLSDTIRTESPAMIDDLSRMGIRPVLLTGDNANAAQTMARKLHIDELHANCLPEDKLNFIKECASKHESVCMTGDGVNDAPALKAADVGIAMGGTGSDIAIDSADIALTNDDIKELPHLIDLSRHMMRTIKMNMTFSMALNFLAIALAITGILNPIVGALVHNAGSVVVIVNSALLLRYKKRK